MSVRLSPTNLTRWYTSGCPAAWKFSQDYDVLTPNIHLAVGNMVHGLMEGALSADKPEPYFEPDWWKAAVTIYKKLLTWKADLGLTVVRNDQGLPLVEFKYEWDILPGIRYVCKADALVFDSDGVLAIVDYKSTLGNGWKNFILSPEKMVVPQALGFQSESYLIKPPKKVRTKLGLTEDVWPERLYYLVGPARGPCQVFHYDKDKQEYANFKAALKLAAASIQNGYFPKVKGKQCFECDFARLCYGRQDLEGLFAARAARVERPD